MTLENQTFKVACNYACLGESQYNCNEELPKKVCELGLSGVQINIIAITRNNNVPLGRLQFVLKHFYNNTIHFEALRGQVTRLRQKGLLGLSPLKTCPFIQNFQPMNAQENAQLNKPINTPSNIQQNIQKNTPINTLKNNSRLKEEEKENLSILNSHKYILERYSNENIAKQYPLLSASGFSKKQIEQIIFIFIEKEFDFADIGNSLMYAEWELTNAQMKTAEGYIIKSPTDWVFSILSNQGYYPRPKNYLSPEEQQEQENEAKLKALQETEQREKEAKEEALKAQKQQKLQSWLNKLSEENKTLYVQEIQHAYGGKYYPPDDVLLNQYFEELVNSNLA